MESLDLYFPGHVPFAVDLVVQITYLKMDIEGNEFAVVQSWREWHQHLPLQVRGW